MTGCVQRGFLRGVRGEVHACSSERAKHRDADRDPETARAETSDMAEPAPFAHRGNSPPHPWNAVAVHLSSRVGVGDSRVSWHKRNSQSPRALSGSSLLSPTLCHCLSHSPLPVSCSLPPAPTPCSSPAEPHRPLLSPSLFPSRSPARAPHPAPAHSTCPCRNIGICLDVCCRKQHTPLLARPASVHTPPFAFLLFSRRPACQLLHLWPPS